jgi:hypothetical protein
MALISGCVFLIIPQTLPWCGVGKMAFETDSLPI